MRRLPPLFLLLLVGCTQVFLETFSDCDLALEIGEELEAAPGEEVLLPVSPATTTYDTVVRVGGVEATVIAVDRSESCVVCDSCLAEVLALACDTCDDCDPVCVDACETCEGTETVSFLVPPLPPGPHVITVSNRHGTSRERPVLTVPGEIDTGDSGTPDTGDSGRSDTADSGDSGSAHTADSGDSGATDSGGGDSGAM